MKEPVNICADCCMRPVSVHTFHKEFLPMNVGPQWHLSGGQTHLSTVFQGLLTIEIRLLGKQYLDSDEKQKLCSEDPS